MPSYAFYLEDRKDRKGTPVFVDLTEDEEKSRRRDYEEVQHAKDYRKKHEPYWREGARTYNVTQEGTTDDRVTNIFIGLGRMIMDQGIGMMTEGEPDFDYDPMGPSDHKKAILWKSAVKMVLSQCNYKSHQDKFITDFHVFGPGVYEVYTQTPHRTLRYEQEDGSIIEKVARDFRRTKVGVRHVSPFDCWRNPNVSDPDDVPSCGKEEILTRAQFIQNYASQYCMDANGLMVPKYNQKYIKILLSMSGTHFKVSKLENEVQDSFRIYAIPFGENVEGAAPPPPNDLGLPIFDKPLKIKKDKKGNRTQGANVLGQTTLCFAANNDMYDGDFKHHSIYGMGIPRLIEGPNMALQAFVNLAFDNMRLANTVPISYKSYDGKTGLDFDMGMLYSGMLIDGEVVASPLGTVNLAAYDFMRDWLNELSIAMTGINFQQLVGDTSKTAFEFAQRIRQNNQRAEKRLRSLENGCLKRMARLLLANILSELTVEEWEDLTESDVKAITNKVTDRQMTAEDYKPAEGSEPAKKRIHQYIKVEGRKFREDFTGSKNRKLNYDSTDNTLIEDPSMSVEASYVPMDKAYLYPADDIESILSFDIRVDGKRMLGDLKAQDMEMMDKALRLGAELAQVSPELAQALDFKKMYVAAVKVAGLEEDDVLKSGSDSVSPMVQQTQQAIQDIEATLTAPTTPAPNAAPSPGTPAPAASQANAARPPAPTGAEVGPPAALAATASGNI